MTEKANSGLQIASGIITGHIKYIGTPVKYIIYYLLLNFRRCIYPFKCVFGRKNEYNWNQ